MKPTTNSLFPYYTEINLQERVKVRHYRFPNNEIVTIHEPKFLIVSDNGHRIFDTKGVSHYIPYGWIHLWWENVDDGSFYCKDKENDKSLSPEVTQ